MNNVMDMFILFYLFFFSTWNFDKAYWISSSVNFLLSKSIHGPFTNIICSFRYQPGHAVSSERSKEKQDCLSSDFCPNPSNKSNQFDFSHDGNKNRKLLQMVDVNQNDCVVRDARSGPNANVVDGWGSSRTSDIWHQQRSSRSRFVRHLALCAHCICSYLTLFLEGANFISFQINVRDWFIHWFHWFKVA